MMHTGEGDMLTQPRTQWYITPPHACLLSFQLIIVRTLDRRNMRARKGTVRKYIMSSARYLWDGSTAKVSSADGGEYCDPPSVGVVWGGARCRRPN